MSNIIEPCCAERQIGHLLREHRAHAVMLQTNGDVTAKVFIKDTMLLSGDRPRTLTISAPVLPVNAMRLVRRYAELGYIAKLRLLLGSESPLPTQGGAGGGSDSSLSTLHSSLNMELALTPNPPSLLMWQGSEATVLIQGPMPDAVTPSLHLYAALLCGNQSTALRAATDPFEALFRARRYQPASPAATPTPATEAGSAAAPASASAPAEGTAVQSAGVLASDTKKKSNP